MMPNTKAVGVAYSDPEFESVTVTGAVAVTGAVTGASVSGGTVYASSELGYTADAQGTVTQATDKTTAVTLNKAAGRITMAATALAGNTAVTFTMNNSFISANDSIVVNVSGGATAAAYTTYISSMTAGSAVIALRNLTAGSLSEAVVINFALIHCV
jgi:hypothetical protein